MITSTSISSSFNHTVKATSQVKSSPQGHFSYNLQFQQTINTITPQFNRIIQPYLTFIIGFIFLACVEISLFVIFLPFLSQSFLLAISLALMFLTFFLFLILRLYLISKKPDQLNNLVERFVNASKSIIQYEEGNPSHHFAISNACFQFASTLKGKENSHFSLPNFLQKFPFLSSLTAKLSAWSLWHDYHAFKELLIQVAVNEHIKLIRKNPTDPELHTALANAYVIMSSLYVIPRKLVEKDDDLWIPSQQYSEIMLDKFRQTVNKAIEEFKILKDFAPYDPWVYAQLAYSYHDLDMHEEEIKAYETILELRPHDDETLYRLGTLYFQKGLNAKGLSVYKELKQLNTDKAEKLIQNY